MWYVQCRTEIPNWNSTLRIQIKARTLIDYIEFYAQDRTTDILVY